VRDFFCKALSLFCSSGAADTLGNAAPEITGSALRLALGLVVGVVLVMKGHR
jgi:hypothetical protein